MGHGAASLAASAGHQGSRLAFDVALIEAIVCNCSDADRCCHVARVATGAAGSAQLSAPVALPVGGASGHAAAVVAPSAQPIPARICSESATMVMLPPADTLGRHCEN